MKEKNETSPVHQILFYICWMTCVQNFKTLSGFKLSNVLWGIPQGQKRHGLVRGLPRQVHNWSEAEEAGSFAGRFVKYGNRLDTHWL